MSDAEVQADCLLWFFWLFLIFSFSLHLCSDDLNGLTGDEVMVAGWCRTENRILSPIKKIWPLTAKQFVCVSRKGSHGKINIWKSIVIATWLLYWGERKLKMGQRSYRVAWKWMWLSRCDLEYIRDLVHTSNRSECKHVIEWFFIGKFIIWWAHLYFKNFKCDYNFSTWIKSIVITFSLFISPR